MVSWIILAVFIIITIFMVLKKIPAIFALPLMAVLIAAISGIPFFSSRTEDGTLITGIQDLIFAEGSIRLASSIVTMIFGSILGQIIKNTGIAETMIKKVSELAGDRMLVLCILVSIVLSLLFTSLAGLGSFIMVGNIAIPILISVGIPPLVAGCILLFSMSVGGIFNMVNWALYQSVLGLSNEQIKSFAYIFGAVMALTGLLFMIIELKVKGVKTAWPAPAESGSGTHKKVNVLAFFTPIIPLILVFFFKWEINSAFIVGILYGCVTTISKDSLSMVTKSTLSGVSEISAPLFLMMGIGMLLKAVMDPRVTVHIGGAISSLLPSNPFTYVLFFAILAPLALYRGPLNLWGLGLGLVAIIADTGKLAPMAVMAAFLTVGQIQGVCDPTNTYNVWTAQTIGNDVNDILKKTIPYVWAAAVVGLILSAVLYV
jgi:hypothetical protein